MKKKHIINEFVDNNNSLIGSNNRPEYNRSSETEASQTTDKNVFSHAQKFSHDFLGRFGFYFYEGDNDDVNVDRINEFIKLLKVLKDDMFSFFKENKINSLKDGFNKYIDSIENQLSGVINEEKVDEVLTDKKIDAEIQEEKDEDEFSDNVKTVADILSKFDNNDINKLITLLEKNK